MRIPDDFFRQANQNMEAQNEKAQFSHMDFEFLSLDNNRLGLFHKRGGSYSDSHTHSKQYAYNYSY